MLHHPGVAATALAVLAAASADCGKASPGAPTNAPNAPTRVTVTGRVIDRIDGSAISGSVITLRGQDTKTAEVTNGSYSIPDILTGTYEATITGSSHVEHKTSVVAITPANASSLSFSVLEWGSGRFGVQYDADFDQFFRMFARNDGNPSTHRGIEKWDLSRNPPREFYISMTSPSPFHLNWDAVAAQEFMNLLQEVNSEQLPDMYCGRVQPVAITSGPSVGLYRPNAVIVAISTNTTQISDQHRVNGFLDGSVMSLYDSNYNNPSNYTNPLLRENLKSTLLHELAHSAGAFHAFLGDYPSIMGNGFHRLGGITNEDRLAFCIIYNDDSKPGNLSPDTNP